jgi:DNA primase
VRYDIDFTTLKRRASFAIVLDRYGLARPSRHRHFILCPFHREKDPSCRIDHGRNRFHCFGCGATGSILDFVARLEGCTIREAAALVAAYCGMAAEGAESAIAADAGEPDVSGGAERADGASPGSDTGNRPLGFMLRLDPSHPYLVRRGLTPEAIAQFGLGFCDRGVMRGRIAIPIHDEEGRLIAYAGRWAAAEVPADRPRYLLPPGFRKQRMLFNLHRAKAAHTLTIVESYWSVFRLAALGAPAVGLMGRELSPAHVELLRGTAAERIQLMLDGDPPGRSASGKILPELARHFFVRNIELPDRLKPHSAPEEVLRRLIGIS